jgi:hypothetical protein
VFHVKGATGVDNYLYKELQTELNQIDGLTQELYRETKNESEQLQDILAKDRAASRARTDRLDLRQIPDGERFRLGREGQYSFI